MVSSIRLRRSPTRTQRNRRTSQVSKQQKDSKYLDNKFWRPYRNDDKLTQQVYRLTHPDYLELAELEIRLKWPTF